MCNLDMSKSNELPSFDNTVGRRSLHQNYKLTTADTSQVCDGRNWEVFRLADKKDVLKRYRPARARSSSRSRARTEQSNSEEGKFSKPNFDSDQSPNRPSKSRQGRQSRRHSEMIGPVATNAAQMLDMSRRRSYGDSEGPETSASSNRVTVRKLSEPMHRCSTTNESVSSIMRRAKYSSNNLAAMGGGPTEINFEPRRSDNLEVSCVLSISDHGENKGIAPMVDSKMRRCDSVPVIAGNEKNWVATGVDFSQSMEVYVFKN